MRLVGPGEYEDDGRASSGTEANSAADLMKRTTPDVDPAALQGEILQAVSRSFFLTLRVLPRGMRAPASLGYLLARLSDTIADAGRLEEAARRELLQRFREAVASPGDPGAVPELAAELRRHLGGAGLTKGERHLVWQASECFDWLRGLGAPMAGHVRKVVTTITDGQLWDLDRFAGEGVVRLSSVTELDLYTYRVAGCVGEFWTEIGFAGRRRFSTESREQLREWGAGYGKALQLVNILRDLPNDLDRGRCYLPGDRTPGGKELTEAARSWIPKARQGMVDGLRYTQSLCGLRLQIATGLPALLGLRTLDLLKRATWADLEAGVKVSRREVRASVRQAIAASVPWMRGGWE